jgi:hypothetical protein
MRWAIRVTYENGEDAWLRSGSAIDEGPIVQFRSREAAERQADFAREGLDEGQSLTIVRLDRLTERIGGVHD